MISIIKLFNEQEAVIAPIGVINRVPSKILAISNNHEKETGILDVLKNAAKSISTKLESPKEICNDGVCGVRG